MLIIAEAINYIMPYLDFLEYEINSNWKLIKKPETM